ncbi:MAG: PA0069 family radical SAM protein [Chromatiales bacterium]|nr:PA0069 family radical SAM protein [Chromatiales bacterium]
MPPGSIVRGRGVATRPAGRFAREELVPEIGDDEPAPAPATELITEQIRSIISRNQSPDIPFEQSLNPYRGCEHGCVYCYARPSHAYLDLSPGLDFEQKIFTKPEAASVLRRELSKPGYACRPITLGSNTDAWQPVERNLGITRQVLEVLVEFRHPVNIITKSALVERDLDLLQDLARDNLVDVLVSVTTLDDELKRRLEPRTPGPRRRLETLRRLSAAGIPCGVLAAPMIPGLNDHELESILEAAAGAGARYAGYVLLRLPHEVEPIFQEWLQAQYPLKAAKVLSLIRQVRGGALNDARFGRRMRGSGPIAALLSQRFAAACRRYGFTRESESALDTTCFCVPAGPGTQLDWLGG